MPAQPQQQNVHFRTLLADSRRIWICKLSLKQGISEAVHSNSYCSEEKKKTTTLTFQGIQKFYWVIFQKHFWCSINKAQESDSCHVIFFRAFQWRVSWTSHSNTASHDPDTWPRYTRYPVSIIYRFTPEAQETTYFFFKIHTDYLLTLSSKTQDMKEVPKLPSMSILLSQKSLSIALQHVLISSIVSPFSPAGNKSA